MGKSITHIYHLIAYLNFTDMECFTI